MNNTNDLDRVLADWLAEGPSHAPDRPIDLAIEHARAHPRRWDLLGFLRRDPMASRSRFSAFSSAPAVALLSLLLVAGLGVAAVGSGLVGLPTVAPDASVSPSPIVASPTPVAPSPSPSASVGTPSVIRVDLEETAGEDATVDVTDESGLLVEARSGQPGEGGFVDELTVTNVDPTMLQLRWVGLPCDTTHSLTIEAGLARMTLERPMCTGDAFPMDRILLLTFSQPVDAADVEATLVDRQPKFSVELDQGTVENVTVSVIDDSDLVIEADAGAGNSAATEINDVAVENVDPRSLRVSWIGTPCETAYEVRVDETARLITVTNRDCLGDSMAVGRVVVLRLSEPVPSGEVRAERVVTDN
jgi:hypothetical protein